MIELFQVAVDRGGVDQLVVTFVREAGGGLELLEEPLEVEPPEELWPPVLGCPLPEPLAVELVEPDDEVVPPDGLVEPPVLDPVLEPLEPVEEPDEPVEPVDPADEDEPEPRPLTPELLLPPLLEESVPVPPALPVPLPLAPEPDEVVAG